MQGAGNQATTRSPVIGTAEAVAVIMGLVIGAGIFTLPAAVAAHVGNAETLYLTWVAGALLTMIGAACYAELATTWPDTGGEYAFLRRAFGAQSAFLFAWARASVIVTGSLAFLAFTYGDYMSALVPLGPASAALHGAAAVVALTAINLRGLRTGTRAQSVLTALEASALVTVVVVGLVLLAPAAAPSAETAPLPAPGPPSLATALLFVMFAYGGWNEAAYLSAETRNRATLVRALWISLVLVMLLYLLVNVACVQALGFAGVAASRTVVSDVLARAFGPAGALVMSAFVSLAMLTSLNATMIAGARSNHALGRDHSWLAWLANWDAARGVPVAGLLLQAVLTLALLVIGAQDRDGLRAMVDYTAPVFWLFFLLVGLALFRLRWREPSRARPYPVPLYPLPPLIFCATSAWLLYASLSHARMASIAGVGVLVLGLALWSWSQGRRWRAGLYCAAALGLIVRALASAGT